MTPLQRLQIRQSETRESLNALLMLDDLTDEQRESLAELTASMQSGEVELRAAIAAEPDPTITPIEVGDGGDAEARELRELRSRVSIADYVGAAAENRSVDGAALEFNAAMAIGANRFPLSILAPPETRAETDASGQATQGTWVDRLFAATMAAYIGVTFQAVPAGVAAYPVTTAGASGVQRARMEAVSASAWTVATTELKPKRNTATMIFSSEDAYRLPGLEDALARDLRMAITESVDAAIFKGDDAADGTDADIAGLQTLAGTEKTLIQANKVKGPETLKAFLELVDGKHAATLADVRVVASVGSNVLWGTTVLPAPATTGETVAQFLMRAGLTWQTRGGIDTTTDNGDFGAYIGLQRGITGAGTAAVWSSGELIRDPYSGAAKGEVHLTLAHAWDFALPRASNFARLKFVT